MLCCIELNVVADVASIWIESNVYRRRWRWNCRTSLVDRCWIVKRLLWANAALSNVSRRQTMKMIGSELNRIQRRLSYPDVDIVCADVDAERLFFRSRYCWLRLPQTLWDDWRTSFADVSWLVMKVFRRRWMNWFGLICLPDNWMI